jgi:hypothetical protein
MYAITAARFIREYDTRTACALQVDGVGYFGANATVARVPMNEA